MPEEIAADYSKWITNLIYKDKHFSNVVIEFSGCTEVDPKVQQISSQSS